jgi:hypothetical protein
VRKTLVFSELVTEKTDFPSTFETHVDKVFIVAFQMFHLDFG